MKLKAFHAYDIRGHFGTDLTCEIAYKVAYFLPELLDTRKVLIGRDMRLSSPALHESVVKGLLDAGADIYDLGLSTTPFVYYVTAKHGFKASIQITASHNPKEDNGLKISREDALPVGYEAGLHIIEQWIIDGRPTPVAEVRGTLHEYDVRDEYVEFLNAFKQDFSNLTIGMDCSNGMASIFVHSIFGEQPHYLYDTLDGSFPNHAPNPFEPQNVVDLQKLVVADHCDIGVIYDGDADRVMFIDENGSFIAPDLIIALMGEYFIKEKGENGIVLQDIRSSKSVAEWLEPQGSQIAMWKVGRAFAAPKLRELGGVWGGEVAGHYYFRDFFYCDSGILAGILVLNIVAKLKREGVKFSEMMSRIKRYENSGEINFRVEDKASAMEAVKKHFSEAETPLASYDFDGYRLEFKDWWFNVRPSNTEPYLRFLCEATSQKLLEQRIAEARSIIEGFV
ncbi:MAG: phosphomannomutase/phosphoglucomutase [Bacteroidales bacterium]|nr:phosphomannomutase/phosphoglucomutase [Bacteroidales bacterium]